MDIFLFRVRLSDEGGGWGNGKSGIINVQVLVQMSTILS